MVSNDRIIDEQGIGKDLEESARCRFDLLSQNLPSRTQENHKELRIACVEAKIRNDHLSNTVLELYVCLCVSPQTLLGNN
jgi:hypothetical protein